ncbi:uncharacterized protein LOC131627905 [Vicia villosa]|uniref:uncharacterized protein LOC131627905 n=1 Tax=Vicia villosa TaxID=3911 RepID=UPI00273C7573|nr:uncharacterized protein LOC131627905 [Vicia villosa]
MVDRVYKLQTKLLQKSQEVSIEDDNSTANSCLSGKRKSQVEITPKDMFKRGITRSEEFQKMFESPIKHGIGFKPPTYHEIIVKRRRTILNFLVNSPKGTVFLKSIDACDITKTTGKIFKMIDDIVEEVGEENVVQVITDNAANYKAAGELLMEKRTKLYWTPCASQCIDLMLEDFENKIPLHKDTIVKGKKIITYIYARTSLISLLHKFTNNTDLIRPAMTRFATFYLTLGCLNDHRGELINMFNSKEWKTSKIAKSKDGIIVEEIVLDKLFWKNVLNCMRSAFPLIRMLRMVDSDEKSTMGFIYEEMDRAKEKIRLSFNGIAKSYNPLWKIIDQRWDKQLHRSLHAAGLYLNPILRYAPGFTIDNEVTNGLIDLQLEDFKGKAGSFGSDFATFALQTKIPTQWWDSYRGGHPELQWFDFRVLSLTCNSSRCERNLSTFERVHTKKRNHLKQNTMNKVVFVMTNSKLGKKKNKRKSANYEVDEIDYENEGEKWIANVEDNEDDEDITLDAGEDASGVIGDDLDVPSIVEDGVIEVEENEDENEEEDLYDYHDIRMHNILDD